MKRTFRDDDRHASISSQTWSDFPRLSLRGRTFLTITCATGMAIDQPCKSNNSVPSNVLSLLFYFLFFFAQISLDRQSPLPATKKLEYIYYLYPRNIMKIFLSFFIHTYIEFYCILHRRWSKDLLSKNLLHLQLLFSFKKRRLRDLRDLHYYRILSKMCCVKHKALR